MAYSPHATFTLGASSIYSPARRGSARGERTIGEGHGQKNGIARSQNQSGDRIGRMSQASLSLAMLRSGRAKPTLYEVGWNADRQGLLEVKHTRTSF